MSTFDSVAPTFDSHRALPSGVPEAIREAVWQSVGNSSGRRVLDLGAGTGRVGRAFVTAGDAYFGADVSIGMLRKFIAQQGEAKLVQADGERLPFPNASFDVVLLVQVLSGARAWRRLIGDAQRVLRPGGALIVGQTVGPPDGVDARMKKHLQEHLEKQGAGQLGSGKGRADALAWLASTARIHRRVIAASWTSSRTPREFIERHRTGSRFSTLPPLIQERALEDLRSWAESAFGSLDAMFDEPYVFELQVFEF